MKKLLRLLILIPIFLFGTLSMAQNSNGWDPVFLTVSGSNIYDGVALSWQKSTCNGQDVVYLHIVNSNDYAVEVSWYNAIFKQDLKWVYNEDAAKKVQLFLEPGAELTGDCSSENSLRILISNMLTNPSDFFKFGVTDFDVTSK